MNKVALIIGSLRKESLNRKLANALIKMGHPALELSICPIEDIPLYNQDHEDKLPKPVADFKQTIINADAILWVSPEYNRSIPGVVKNVIDWGTRPMGQSVWADKLMASIGTSPGAIGTAVAQSHMRSIMVALGAIFFSRPEVYLVYKDGLIDNDNNVLVPETQDFLKKFLELFAKNIQKYHQKWELK